LIIGLYQSLYKAMANTPMDMVTLTRHLYPFMDITRILPINNQFLWMDLSQPERLFLPFLTFGIPIMAIVVMATTYVQSKLLTPASANPKDQTAMMGNMMNLYMPFLMGYMGLPYFRASVFHRVQPDRYPATVLLGKRTGRTCFPNPGGSGSRAGEEDR
jgi:YidC/Oxa1 family membrane protein insertase